VLVVEGERRPRPLAAAPTPEERDEPLAA
jgi:hypothetical protein